MTGKRLIGLDTQQRCADYGIALRDAGSKPVAVPFNDFLPATVRPNGVGITQRRWASDVRGLSAIVRLDVQDGVAHSGLAWYFTQVLGAQG